MKALTFESAAVKSRMSGGGVLLMRACLILSLCLCTVSMCLADPAHAAIRKDLNVPAEDLSSALQQVATTYELQVLYPTQIAKDLKTHGAVGTFTSDEALIKVLSGTGLSYKYLDANTVTVFATAASVAAATAAGQDQTANTQDKEAGKNSSQDFRVAQVDQGTPGPQTISDDQNSKRKNKSEGLEEIVVTGSRIQTEAQDSAYDVQVYDRAVIDQSGQTNVAGFLNTIPAVSVSVSENGLQTTGGGTTVQLRGLPIGTTLILINGRRTQTSSTETSPEFFDLNTIPVAAVERIEVIAEGASAIYGSDAIAGVINIILKKNLDGFAANVRYGGASDTNETDADLSWGKQWKRGSLDVVASYLTRTALDSTKRAVTNSPSTTFPTCLLGNVFSADGVTSIPGLGTATYAAVPTGFTGKPSIQEFKGTANTLNECSAFVGYDLIPATHRASVLAEGSYNLTPSVEVFSELMWSHVKQFETGGYQSLFGEPGFQSYSAAATNPYNPFGTKVGVSTLLTQVPIESLPDEEFYRALVGARGKLFSDWKWEISAYEAVDTNHQVDQNFASNAPAIQQALNSANPATALNPFGGGPVAPPQLLSQLFSNVDFSSNGRGQVVNGFAQGPVGALPSGPIAMVIGAEYGHDTLSFTNITGGNVRSSYSRDNYAIFGEARVPLIGKRTQSDDVLDLSLAGRFDRYSDFGSTTTPQAALAWRPSGTLLVRATYAEAFKAPGLYELHTPQMIFAPSLITDPTTGQSYAANVLSGGNPNLRPETGWSRTFGFVYSSDLVRNLQIAVTDWTVVEDKAIQTLPVQFIVDNGDLFPGRVVRNPAGVITLVDDTELNFGAIEVSGVDYRINYKIDSTVGQWSPTVNISQTYKYNAALSPGVPSMDGLGKAQDSGDWAPRWKLVAGLGWTSGPYVALLTGRYVSHYQDYDSNNTIGDFWLFDGNLRYNIGAALNTENKLLGGAYVELGGVNLFNRLPQRSNYLGGLIGYDPSQADLRGRFLYVQLGGRW
jgi:iron complex outermembrane recepter protein